MEKFRIFRKAFEKPIILENTFPSRVTNVTLTNDFFITVDVENLSYVVEVQEGEAKELEITKENGIIKIVESINTIN